MNDILKQFKFWTIHVTLTSLTSFVIAYKLEYNSVADIAGMIAALLSFALIFTALTSLPTYQKLKGSVYDQAIRLGTKVRMVISLASLPLALSFSEIDDVILVWVPDYWCGVLAYMLTSAGLRETSNQSIRGDDFISTYLLTMTEGLIIAATLVIVSFFTLIFVNARARKKQNQSLQGSINAPNP